MSDKSTDVGQEVLVVGFIKTEIPSIVRLLKKVGFTSYSKIPMGKIADTVKRIVQANPGAVVLCDPLDDYQRKAGTVSGEIQYKWNIPDTLLPHRPLEGRDEWRQEAFRRLQILRIKMVIRYATEQLQEALEGEMDATSRVELVNPHALADHAQGLPPRTLLSELQRWRSDPRSVMRIEIASMPVSHPEAAEWPGEGF